MKCPHESAGKRVKGGHNKIGNSHLKWAFSEAAVLFLRNNESGKNCSRDWSVDTVKQKLYPSLLKKSDAPSFICLNVKSPFPLKVFFKDSVHAPKT